MAGWSANPERRRPTRRLAALLLCAVLPAQAAQAEAAPPTVERGALRLSGVPEIPPAFVESLLPYQNARGARFEGWMDDGGLLITTRFGETAQVHRVAAPGAARTQLTFFAEPVAEAQPRPGGGFVFGKDRGGDEFYQLWLYDPARGAGPLTQDRARNGGAHWSNRGDVLAYATTRRNGRDTDLHLLDPASGESRPLLEASGTWQVLDWSPDDRELLALKYLSINHSELWRVSREAGRAPVRVRPSDTPFAFAAARYARDGRGLYVVSDEDADVHRLRWLPLDGGTARAVGLDAPWNVEDFALSPGGAYLAYTLNVDGLSELHLLDLRSGRPRALPALPRGVIEDLAFDRAGQRLGFTLNNARTPGDVYAIGVARRELQRWTASETGGLDAARFVEPELVRYASFDGRSIPAFFYRAPQPGPRPVLIQIHGGPEAQARPLFSPTLEFYLRELGVSVLVPNVRGSDGYGKQYLQLDNGARREDSVRDIGALLDWIATRPELDRARVAVAGGSYGGYMTLASLAHFGERLRCGISTVGISNFVTFLNNTQGYRRDLRRAEYGDERDPVMRAFLERISPTANAARIRQPLFVLQGANDPRVPASEAEQIVDAVRGNGGAVWYLLARDEGHGFRKKTNRDVATHASAWFLRECLAPPLGP